MNTLIKKHYLTIVAILIVAIVACFVDSLSFVDYLQYVTRGIALLFGIFLVVDIIRVTISRQLMSEKFGYLICLAFSTILMGVFSSYGFFFSILQRGLFEFSLFQAVFILLLSLSVHARSKLNR